MYDLVSVCMRRPPILTDFGEGLFLKKEQLKIRNGAIVV